MTTFDQLELLPELQRALRAENYEEPTPIQAQAIPPLLDGRDVLGCAQTGTGKTAAFALPVLQHLANTTGRPMGRPPIRVLVLTPTRELAAQIGDSFATYGRFLKFKHLVIFGGVNENPQITALRKGVDILVATPGRLLDLQGRGHIDLGQVGFFVLDEADRMLDMGFVNDVRRVIRQLPKKRQNLLFSATMPPAITELAGSFLKDPVRVEVTPQATTVERIEQSVMFVDRLDKRHLLTDLLRQKGVDKAIVFTRTKHGANRLATHLEKAKITAAAIHGNKTQNARNRALAGLKSGSIQVLIATDIASRGIDIDDVSHVFNYDLPNEPESYVHRIGRTARAGLSGIAVSLCDGTEGEYLRAIEKTIGLKIPVVEDHKYHSPAAVPVPGRSSTPVRGSGRGGGGGGNRSRRGGPGPRGRQQGAGGGGGARGCGNGRPARKRSR
ncbi:MAG: DEAD/DEAH box helicase [Myxococcales bacterium]|nr:DEAD/DEAH box helicase [Myxococcales bacterium]